LIAVHDPFQFAGRDIDHQPVNGIFGPMIGCAARNHGLDDILAFAGETNRKTPSGSRQPGALTPRARKASVSFIVEVLETWQSLWPDDGNLAAA